MKTLLVLLVVFICCFGSIQTAINSNPQSAGQCWSGGNGQTAQWWDEGARIDRGKYWYECRNGELVPKGCFTEKKERINVHETYALNGYMVECALDERGYLSFKFVGCTPDGVQRYNVGQTWEDKERMYWFECKPDGQYVKIQIGGCVSHDKSRRLNIGERYDFGEYTYECQRKYNGSVQMCSVGCIHNGVHYKVGEQWPEGEFVFYCKLTGGKTQKMCVGCQFRNKRLYNGDRYQKDDSVYQCEVRSDKYGHKPVGCLVRDSDGTSVERVLGCRWYQTTPESKLEQTCVLENDKSVVKTLGCIYVHKGYDTLFLYPGTYTIWTQSLDNQPIAVACREGSPGNNPRLETIPLSDVGARTQGLKFDQPRGK